MASDDFEPLGSFDWALLDHNRSLEGPAQCLEVS